MTKRTKKSLSNIVLGEESYSYDAAGNITDAPESCFEYDTNNRLVSFGGQTVSYDLDGNMLSATLDCCTSVNFAYDSANRLISAGGHSYTYNAEDVRIRNLHAGQDTTYTYDTNCKLSKLLCKTTNNVTTKYVYGHGLIGEETINTNSFKTYHFDCRGSTIAITNASGAIMDTFEYDTYGKLISHTGPSDVIFGYNGRDGVVTDENGFIYMRARYYSPDMRRFVNADIIHGSISDSTSLNRYAYVNGNPVSFIDPFGLSKDDRGGDGNWFENSVNWVDNNIIRPIEEFFSPDTNTVGGTFNEGVFSGEGSVTLGYSDTMLRAQGKQTTYPQSGMPSVAQGIFAKASILNASGKTGIGNDDLSLNLKGVGDVLVADAHAGVAANYKDGFGFTAKAQASVFSGRATIEFEFFGNQVELGVTGHAISVGAQATVGYFDGEFLYKADASLGAGGGVIVRIKPKQ